MAPLGVVGFETMPLFEQREDEMVPFRRLIGGAELYEREIEDLLWANLEEFCGETIFPVARQPSLPSGGIPDVVGLDKTGRVIIFEVKRDVDRRHLAQCLEYAGWARTTNLDELAGLYHTGESAFWSNWPEFTESATPVVVNPQPRLALVARDFQARTESAFEFLVESGVPVQLIRVVVYEDAEGRRFVDIEGDHEPEVATGPGDERRWPTHTRIAGRAMKVADLIEYGLLEAGDAMTWTRPKKGETHRATVDDNGAIRLHDGRTFGSPSKAAAIAAGLNAYDGWYAWTVDRVGKTLDDLRRDLTDMLASGEPVDSEWERD